MKNYLLVLLLIITVPVFAQSYPEMIAVEGGTFTMGDTRGDGSSEEQPTHSVTLKGYKIAKTETTVAQWRTFCDATGRAMPETPSWGWIDSHPIVNISWNDAVEYGDWLSDKTGNIYRLPTEAEWEYAARGGKNSEGFKYFDVQSMEASGWFKRNSNMQTQAVAQKLPNELGLYDLGGNASEWCSDWYGPYTTNAQTNPKGSTTGEYHVIRGDSWFSSAGRYRVSNRDLGYFGPANREARGFRVVSSL